MVNTLVLYGLLLGGMGWLQLQNVSKNEELKALRVEMAEQKAELNNKLDTIKFNTIALEQKKAVEKEIKYDKSKSVSVNSTRFYLD